MKINSAFPHLLGRRYPIVKPAFPMLTVLYLLRILDVAAVPLVEGPTSRRAVFGFSSLSKLIGLAPRQIDEFLEGPCERAADALDAFTPQDDLDDLLAAFMKRRLGFSIVQGTLRQEPRTSLVSLTDLIGLYKTGRFSSSLTVEDVASPITSMSGRNTIREALVAMYRLRHRRMFITGGRKYVSDRSIIDRVFSPGSLERARNEAEVEVLDARIDQLTAETATEVPADTSVVRAALLLRGDRGPCLTIRGRDLVVTPWDVVMKPWGAGKLTIRARPV